IDTADYPVDLNHLRSIFGITEANGSIYAGAQGDAALLTAERGGRTGRSFVAFERDLSIITLSFWPKAAVPTLLVGATSQGTWRALAGLFDLEAQRFRPGLIDVGHGVINRIRDDGKGRLLVLLPWSAELVRLTPR